MGGRVAVVASDWLRPRLGSTWRTGVVVGVTPRAAYVGIEARDAPAGGDGESGQGRLLAIETGDAVGLPNGMVVADPGVLARVVPGQQVTLDDAAVSVGAWSLVVRRWRRSRPVPGPADAAVVVTRLRALGVTSERPVPSDWPDPDPYLAAGAAALAAAVRSDVVPGRLDEVLDGLAGYGPGSTPAGDDVLAAVVATAAVLGARWEVPTPGLALLAARAAAMDPGRTTALSATLLACAADGAMAHPAAATLAALTAAPGVAPSDRPSGSEHGVAQALDVLARVGHTSGRDLALGMLATTVALAAARTTADGSAPPVDRARSGAPVRGHDDGHHLLPSTINDRSS